MQALFAALFALMLLAQAYVPEELREAMDPNPGLQTYSASAELDVHVRTPIPASWHFVGAASYARPMGSVAFQRVPRALTQFQRLSTTSLTYEDVVLNYTVALAGSDGVHTSFLLTPRTSRNVTGLLVTIDDVQHLIIRLEWRYGRRGTLTIGQRYEDVGGYRLPAALDIDARFSAYHASGTVQFSNYATNVVPAD